MSLRQECWLVSLTVCVLNVLENVANKKVMYMVFRLYLYVYVYVFYKLKNEKICGTIQYHDYTKEEIKMDSGFGDLFKENVPEVKKELTVLEAKNEFTDFVKVTEEYSDSRLGIMFILDHSGSMKECIGEVNEGIRNFIENLRETQKTAGVKLDVGVVSMGGSNAKLIRDFISVDCWEDLTLSAEGVTPLEEAVNLASERVIERVGAYECAGSVYKKPWIVIMSDGLPTDSNGIEIKSTDSRIGNVKRKLRETGCLVYTFYIGDSAGSWVDEAKTILRELATYKDVNDVSKGKMSYVLSEKKDSIKELFLFLSKSVNVASVNVGQVGTDPFNNDGKFVPLW